MTEKIQRISEVEAVELARGVRPLTEINERECVARLAAEVLPGGLIVEIGCLYGGMTAVMGLANPKAIIVAIDDFSWHPEDDVPTSKKLLYENVHKVGVLNVMVVEGDSRRIGKKWDEVSREVLLNKTDASDADKRHIDLLWIDGGHSFEYVYQDICNFGPHAEVIALHDFDNSSWASIRQAVTKFMGDHPEWKIAEVVGTVVVLRKI